jgi:hypothetical protein
VKRALGVSLIVMALVIGIVPLFTDCLSQGRTMVLQNGMTAPMKCHWTAIAEIGIAIPLGLVGLFNVFSRRKEASASLASVGFALGALAALFPTALIGVCANPMMLCNMVMKPTLVLSGIIAMAASTGMVVMSLRAGQATAKMQGAAA